MDTRFAPSPTGELHIGSVRTALFAYLTARHTGGRFDVRIEDTDPERSTEAYRESILHDLEWLGLDWDGLSRQSDAIEEHRQALQTLIDAGHVYRDPNGPDEVLQWRQGHDMRGYRGNDYDHGAWRLRMGDEPFVVADIISGEKTVDPYTIDDPVIARADGSPTFLLANAYDDLRYELIIRGADLQSLAPKQTRLRTVLGGSPATWAHLPIIVGADGKKQSKRAVDAHGNPLGMTVDALRSAGYLPDTICTIIAGLGWGGASEEPLTRDELISRFRIEDVTKANARFDPAKLQHANGVLLRALSTDTYAEGLITLTGWSSERAHKAAVVAQPRSQTFAEAVEMTGFVDGIKVHDAAAVSKWLTKDGQQALNAIATVIATTDMTDADTVHVAFKGLPEQLGMKPVAVFQPLRVALCGSAVGPAVHHAAWALGKDETLRRIDALQTHVKTIS